MVRKSIKDEDDNIIEPLDAESTLTYHVLVATGGPTSLMIRLSKYKRHPQDLGSSPGWARCDDLENIFQPQNLVIRCEYLRLRQGTLVWFERIYFFASLRGCFGFWMASVWLVPQLQWTGTALAWSCQSPTLPPRLVILQEGLFKLGRLAAHQSLLGVAAEFWSLKCFAIFALWGILLCGIGATWLRFARTKQVWLFS